LIPYTNWNDYTDQNEIWDVLRPTKFILSATSPYKKMRLVSFFFLDGVMFWILSFFCKKVVLSNIYTYKYIYGNTLFIVKPPTIDKNKKNKNEYDRKYCI
jgi:hypothetical protein